MERQAYVSKSTNKVKNPTVLLSDNGKKNPNDYDVKL